MQYRQWSTMSAREVDHLQKDLTDLEQGLTISDTTQQLRMELTNLRNKVKLSQLTSNFNIIIINFISTGQYG